MPLERRLSEFLQDEISTEYTQIKNHIRMTKQSSSERQLKTMFSTIYNLLI